jgi:hypothetical protein
VVDGTLLLHLQITQMDADQHGLPNMPPLTGLNMLFGPVFYNDAAPYGRSRRENFAPQV